MIKEALKKYGTIIVACTVVILIFLGLTNIPQLWNVLKEVISILMPFLMATLIALLLLGPCNAMERKFSKSKFKIFNKHKRGISVFICYFVLLAVIVLFLTFAVPIISENISKLMGNLPKMYDNLVDWIHNIPEDSILSKLNLGNLIDDINVGKIQEYFSIDTIMSYIKGVVNFASSLFSIIVTLILSVYMLFDKEKIMKFLSRLVEAIFGEKTREGVISYINNLVKIFSKYISAQFFDSMLVGVVSTIVLLILDVEYAIILGPLIGLSNMIPYFGAIFATGFAVLLTIFTGGIWKAVSVLVFILIWQQIDANIINPKILSDNLELSSLLVILAVTIGGDLFGVIGMFISVPVAVVIKATVMDYIERKEKKKHGSTLDRSF